MPDEVVEVSQPVEASAPESSVSGGDDVIDSIIAAEGNSFDERPTPAVKTDGATQQAPATEAPPEAAPVEETQAQDIETLAAKVGLSLANPRDKQILENLMAELSSRDKQTVETPSEVPYELTEYEKFLLEQNGKPPAAPPEQQPEVPRAPAPAQPRIGDEWKRPEDAYAALTAAYGNGEDPPDLSKVVAIEHEMFDRRFEQRAMPILKDAFEYWLQERLGPMLPEITAIKQKADNERNYQFAIDEISKTKGFENFKKLYEHIDDKKITFRGQEWPNIPVNQVYKKYPQLLNIRVLNKDPNVAARLTHIERLRAVAEHWKEMTSSAKSAANNIPAAQAGDLVKAGAEQERRKQQDRTRQGLNAGTGASGSGVKRDSNQDWFDEVNKSAGGVSLSDLFK